MREAVQGMGPISRIHPALRSASALLTIMTIISDARLLDRLDERWLSSL